MKTESEGSTNPPGIISTLSSAFEMTTAHIWLLMLPILLDVFYWLGPRLRVTDLINRNAALLENDPVFGTLAEQLPQLASQVNLFTTISLPIIGIPTLMSGPVPDITPVNAPSIEVNGAMTWFILYAALSLLGLLLTTMYFGLIGLILDRQDGVRSLSTWSFLKQILVWSARLIGLAILFLFSLVLVSIPLLPAAVFLGLLNNGLFVMIMLVGFVLLIVLFSLTIPGIFLKGKSTIDAIRDSFMLVRRNVLPTMRLLLAVLLISSGLNLLWHMADDGSWLTLASIAGHAFINTSLVVAIFIYYRDRVGDLVNKEVQ